MTIGNTYSIITIEGGNMTESQRKYDAKNTRTFTLKLNKNTDADIIDYLEKTGNVQGCIKELLRRRLCKSIKSKCL